MFGHAPLVLMGSTYNNFMGRNFHDCEVNHEITKINTPQKFLPYDNKKY